MEVRSRTGAEPFTTADGSTIRVLFEPPRNGGSRARGDLSSDRVGGPRVGGLAHARKQSLAEAVLVDGQATERHYHAETEEIYYVLDGTGEMEVDGERALVGPGDVILIPPRAWHQIRAEGARELRFLCCCAPPYRDDDTFFR